MTSPCMDAAHKGETKYNGKPCKTCGGTLRHTINSACVACSNERAKNGMAKRREKLKELLSQAKEAA